MPPMTVLDWALLGLLALVSASFFLVLVGALAGGSAPYPGWARRSGIGAAVCASLFLIGDAFGVTWLLLAAVLVVTTLVWRWLWKRFG